MAGLAQLNGDRAGDASDGLAPSDHAGDSFFVHAVLQRNDETIGREVLANEGGGPGGVIRLYAYESDVDWLLLDELLHLGQVQRAHLGGEFGDIANMRYAQTLRTHRLDVLRPRIDEGDVLTGLRHMRSGIAADCARAHN